MKTTSGIEKLGRDELIKFCQNKIEYLESSGLCDIEIYSVYKIAISSLTESKSFDRGAQIANALESLDWSNTPIGNKCIIMYAIEFMKGKIHD